MARVEASSKRGEGNNKAEGTERDEVQQRSAV